MTFHRLEAQSRLVIHHLNVEICYYEKKLVVCAVDPTSETLRSDGTFNGLVSVRVMRPVSLGFELQPQRAGTNEGVRESMMRYS